MHYGITQCYLPPDRGENPALPPAEAGLIRFSDRGEMQDRVDLCYVKGDRLETEPATCQLQVQRLTAAPSCNTRVLISNQCETKTRIVTEQVTEPL